MAKPNPATGRVAKTYVKPVKAENKKKSPPSTIYEESNEDTTAKTVSPMQLDKVTSPAQIVGSPSDKDVDMTPVVSASPSPVSMASGTASSTPIKPSVKIYNGGAKTVASPAKVQVYQPKLSPPVSPPKVEVSQPKLPPAPVGGIKVKIVKSPPKPPAPKPSLPAPQVQAVAPSSPLPPPAPVPTPVAPVETKPSLPPAPVQAPAKPKIIFPVWGKEEEPALPPHLQQ